MWLRSFRRGGHNGVMHVISGRFKGVALTTPKTGTRPTTDRTKEAIFSHLDSWQVLDDARVLDLFAGTGALGIEALSRGARELVAVESSAPAAALIAKTLTALQRNRSWERGMTARVIRARAEKYVASGAARSASNADAAGGSAFALLTTLNAAVGCVAYPVASACADGWLPRELGERSARTGAPVRLLSVGMIAAECPLIAGNSAKTVSSSVTILMIVVQAMVAVAASRLILRDGSSLCAFRSLPLLGRVPQSGLAALCIVALLVDLLLIAWLLYTMNRLLIIGNVVIFAITVVAAVIVNKYRVDTRP